MFAPDAWDDALKNYNHARTLHEKGDVNQFRRKLEAAREQAQQALAGTSRVRAALSDVLEVRTRARAARAQFIVPRDYSRAEEVLTKAARKVEQGNVEGGREEAKKAEPLFDAAELAALHSTWLGRADSALMRAEAERAGRHAPATLARAHEHRERATQGLVADRYDTLAAARWAGQAEREAGHASSLARHIQATESAKATNEQVFLQFESELERLAQAAGLASPPFYVGPDRAVDTLAAWLSGMAADLAIAGTELAQVSETLGKGLSETGEASPSTHPVELANQASERLLRLTEEKADWARMAQARQAQLAEVSQLADETSYELALRQERAEKFKAAAQLLTVSDGVVLYNDKDDVVLRLTGLSFDPGASDLSARHEKLLAKVVTILGTYDGHGVIVEGHTDARGTSSHNLALSEKRAEAVRNWLIRNTKRAPESLQAKGYGDAHPVASNSTADGRAKNRRIDVVILK